MTQSNNIKDKRIYKTNENLVSFLSQNSKKATLRVEKVIIERKNLNIVNHYLESVKQIFSKKQEYFNPISTKYDWVEVGE